MENNKGIDERFEGGIEVNELIKINYDSEQPTVSARELHESLGIEKRFSAWFDTNSAGFVEGKDYSNPYLKVRVQKEGNRDVSREVEDYDLSVEMAKHICLMSRTEKGKRCRQYLIELEGAWNSPEQIMARALKFAQQSMDGLKERCRFLGGQIVEQQKVISELQPKANYVDTILASKSLVVTTQIAKDYGMSAKAFNKLLYDLGIQYKTNGQWVLYSKWQSQGYVHSRTIDIVRTGGLPDVVMQTEWTQKGRLFLYEQLKANNIVPVIEQKPEKKESE